MARSDVKTYLALDDYAKVMAIPGWLFNQVVHPQRPIRGACDMVWLQGGYTSDPNRITGRDQVAQAIATAERNVANYLNFWLGRRWICAEERYWPYPRNGVQVTTPIVRAKWGYIHSGGVETWDVVHENVPVGFSDEDGDLVTEWATVSLATTITDKCEVVIVPHGYDPELYAIRPLNVDITGGVLTATGWKWLFVRPVLWLALDNLDLDDDNNFIQGGIYDDGVDIYRHYNAITTQAQIVWKNANLGAVSCSESLQAACMRIVDVRDGLWQPIPARLTNGQWYAVCVNVCNPPVSVRSWYMSGYTDEDCADCIELSPAIREAIVRLANTYMVEAPCGCSPTKERWSRDREEMSIDSTEMEIVQSAFGSTMRGAMFAHNIVSRIPPLG